MYYLRCMYNLISSIDVLELLLLFFFFFIDTSTTEIYTLSLHDALPILRRRRVGRCRPGGMGDAHLGRLGMGRGRDRKSTRLNSSHQIISYAVFCLKKKKVISYPFARMLVSSMADPYLIWRCSLAETVWA